MLVPALSRLLDSALLRAEREIALISRCRPRNAVAEQERLLERWRRGDPALPRWSYERVPEMGGLRDELRQIVETLDVQEPVMRLYAERARELELETRLVELVGTKQLRSLAELRFSQGSPRDAEAALRQSERWLRLPPPEAQREVSSDDESSPDSLITAMRRAVGELRLPVAVKLSDTLTAVAATGERVILVARGRKLRCNDVSRIVLHEVAGHALPRHRASRHSLGLFAVGSRRGNDEQEGYALYLEHGAGLMDGARKIELAYRHHAALMVRDGADWVQTTRQLVARGAPVEQAAAIASRVHRARGLAREIVYLPALCRVRRAITKDRHTEQWLAQGRLSLDAIAELRRIDFQLEVND